ncbi:hypothetical protein JA13_053 [Dickeya phage vB_DsoM_JA13]|uniref:ABC transporter domain-containing protein n=1 Tax=Dickeya phage vB_DsoM_JA13 TaxID=2283030 RepID=A0A384ZW49_9CAUD|nr:hypothetical protein JA13_053 [Dickeya phage vB_DsoM_JA13]
MLKKIKFAESLRYFKEEREEQRAEKLVGREFNFESGRINVLVGENGSGKSSLLESLAKKILAYNYGHTRLDDRLIRFNDEYWSKENPDRWYSDELYMPDVSLETDSPIYGMYMSPDWKPCDALNWAHALCYGLGKEATDHFKRTENFSSGQGMSNVITHIAMALKERSPEVSLEEVKYHIRPQDDNHLAKRAKFLQKLLPPAGSNIVAMFDEPERTLDLGSQLVFWQLMNDISKREHVQIIVASHSCIPLMSPDKFNFIEMTDGYKNKLLNITADLSFK